MSESRVKIRAAGVSKTYISPGGESVLAIDGVDLEVRENEFLSIVGPSGCGKSTFLYLVAGVLEVTGGELVKDGAAIRGPGPDRGLVFQHFALFPWRTVMGNVCYGLEEQGLPRPERTGRARELIQRVGLKGFENVYPNQLSGGMKQRVALARTLAYDPEVLLMDEPFGALDAQTRLLMQEELLELWSERKKTVIFITHDVREAVYLSDRVAVMTARPGRIKRIVETRAPGSSAGREHVETQEFVEKVNEIWSLVRDEVVIS
ncbi:MAG: ABC transporter ATP-binding protein [Candidatus Tectomicrobia bacterium RIFCSPLOWO2_12_FULL_69_37]|nr:MAG: ABC transporter ATP-binding protein [Candidatus Tectomicrobia bacterium RIFCSPLOWO2_02_FULL_70_19]OGL67484.1 MAG: ABC transporter ATP-binding protein [Candidatus Tectomicrobia bacterium RIFCSPLOWO2_12_FULL_69_37]